MKEPSIRKLYYSISEVSHLTSLKTYVLRQWESEFEELRPSKNRAGNRIYRLDDIKLIFLIKKLLCAEKYTFDGARQRLRQLRRRSARQRQLAFGELLREDLLFEIKKELGDVLEVLKNSSHH